MEREEERGKRERERTWLSFHRDPREATWCMEIAPVA